jgi:hypothetical protein
VVELRAIEVMKSGTDKIVSAVVRPDRPDNYRRHELFRNKKATRGLIQKHVGDLYGLQPGHVIWPPHIGIHDID